MWPRGRSLRTGPHRGSHEARGPGQSHVPHRPNAGAASFGRRWDAEASEKQKGASRERGAASNALALSWLPRALGARWTEGRIGESGEGGKRVRRQLALDSEEQQGTVFGRVMLGMPDRGRVRGRRRHLAMHAAPIVDLFSTLTSLPLWRRLQPQPT